MEQRCSFSVLLVWLSRDPSVYLAVEKMYGDCTISQPAYTPAMLDVEGVTRIN